MRIVLSTLPLDDAGGETQPAATPPRGSFGFGREHRILRRPEFLHMYATAQKAHGQFAVVYYLMRGEAASAPRAGRPAPLTSWRVGITTTKKLGNAVARNRARRQVREFMRLRGPRWPADADFIVNLKPAANGISSAQLTRDLEKCMRKLGIGL